MSDEPRRLNLRPERKNTPCAFCGGGGVVIRDMFFRPCLCVAGELPGTSSWDGVAVHMLDFVPTVDALTVETKKPVSVAKSVDIQKGGAYAQR
jgi:hypothetical protein